jgi:hypothetical protein
MTELEDDLPISSSSSAEPKIDEKAIRPADEKESPFDADKSHNGCEDEDDKPLYVNGEPVISSGKDVSKYLVDLRDDGDPPITFRSLVLGTVIGGLGAALNQVCTNSTESLKGAIEHSLVDLCFQACPIGDLNSVSTPHSLLTWHFLVYSFPKALFGRGYAIRVAWAYSPLHQPWQIPSQGGAVCILSPMSMLSSLHF